jgi:hypothetical protein
MSETQTLEKMSDLELNKEMLVDLTDSEAEAAKGGVVIQIIGVLISLRADGTPPRQ